MHPVLEKWHKLHKKYLYYSEPESKIDFRTSELANRLGVSRRTIERWVRDKSGPRDQQIEAIERFLDERVQG
jgi:transcriptional regulator with XRE-family HTH domain